MRSFSKSPSWLTECTVEVYPSSRRDPLSFVSMHPVHWESVPDGSAIQAECGTFKLYLLGGSWDLVSTL